MSKHLLYISSGLPKDEVELLRKKQVDFTSNAIMPTSVFHNNILKGLSENYDKCVSLVGAPITRNFNVKYYKSNKYYDDNIEYVIPNFLNYPIIKQITIIVKMFFHILKWNLNGVKGEKHIVIDGTFYTALISLKFANMLFKTKSTAILVDIYDFMKPDIKNFKNKFYFWLLKDINNFVFVTEQLEQLVNINHKDYIIMEGLVDNQLITNDTISEINQCCIYAGGLHEIYGVKNLVDAFHSTNIDLDLCLYGNGEMVDYIKEMNHIDSRIKYMGIISHDELINIERKALFLVNPRFVYGKLDTRYSFPSKLMEYMQSGRPVITTKLLGIPKEYDELMYYFEDDTVDGIKKGLERIFSYSEEVLSNQGSKAKNYVNNNKTNIIIGKQIHDLF